MSQDPRETFKRLQRSLQEQGRRGFGGGLPGGRGAIGGAGGLILLGIAGVVASNALFNGKLRRT